MKAYATFDRYAADQSAKNRKIIAAPREFVKRIAPQLEESVKWGNGCWLGAAGPVVYVDRASSVATPSAIVQGARSAAP